MYGESVSLATPNGPLDKANLSQQAVKQIRTISRRRRQEIKHGMMYDTRRH